jgi:Putative addiction module component
VKRKAVDILKEALALPSSECAALAGSLLDSLDTDVDEDAEAAWAIEENRRVAELDSGAAKTVLQAISSRCDGCSGGGTDSSTQSARPPSAPDTT